MCSIHNDKTVSAELMAMSGGWGGRGQGLGLLACVTGSVEGEEDEDHKQEVRCAHDVISHASLSVACFSFSCMV